MASFFDKHNRELSGFPQEIGQELGQLFEQQAVQFGAEVIYEQAEAMDLMCGRLR